MVLFQYLAFEGRVVHKYISLLELFKKTRKTYHLEFEKLDFVDLSARFDGWYFKFSESNYKHRVA